MQNREYISYEQCRSYIITRIIEETPCKENLLIICEWLFSIRGIQCYQTRKDIRFDYENTTNDMFFGIVCQKSSARVDLYVGKKNRNDLPEYVKLNDNPSRGWAYISGKDTKVLSVNQLKNLITDSFADRFGGKIL